MQAVLESTRLNTTLIENDTGDTSAAFSESSLSFTAGPPSIKCQWEILEMPYGAFWRCRPQGSNKLVARGRDPDYLDAQHAMKTIATRSMDLVPRGRQPSIRTREMTARALLPPGTMHYCRPAIRLKALQCPCCRDSWDSATAFATVCVWPAELS